MATIEPRLDGPLIVKGVTQCVNSRGEALAVKDPFFLCRCGASANKPFCDGSHKKIGFTAPGPLARAGVAPSAATPEVQVTKNGSYQVTGVPDLHCESPPDDPDKYFLCRCGRSKTKPYCDGSHRAAGFADDKN
jgi:CDGSH-type Zn-finger protein